MITADGLRQLGFSSEVDYTLQNDGGETYIKAWYSSDPQPSEADIEAAHAIFQTAWTSKAYSRSRQPEYPPIGDQLDALFQAGVFPADMTAKLQAVKDKYPK